jgi:pimeloyl-ACP methyl ester carboxylesterase
MGILLISGLWLEASAWANVTAKLEADGHRVRPIALPGQGDGNTSATLADQLAAVVTAIDAAQGKAFVVGHSASVTLAWLAVDARPGKVGKVAFIGGFPSGDGGAYFDFMHTVSDALPFPGWDAFDEADYADLDENARQELAAAAIPSRQALPRQWSA